MPSLRIITDEVVSHISSQDNKYLIKQASHIIPRPQGKALLVAFTKHLLDTERNLHPIVKEAIEKDFGIVYVCDRLPDGYIIDPHIVYAVTPWAFLTHTLFFNPLLFKGVFHNKHTKDTALAFSVFTKYNIPIINSPDEIKDFSEVCEQSTGNILLEITGGIGDCLMCIPTIKTLNSKGKKVFILCDAQRVPCFAGLTYIEKIYTQKSEINSQLFDRVYWLDFGSLLNDYRSDLNKKNRIYSISEICGIQKEELVISIPEIKLTDEETKKSQELYGDYPKKIFFGFGSNRADAIIPQEKTQEIINKLKINGFTVFISSLRGYNFENCINLTGKLSLREYFSLINSMDYILTVDSSPLHIAGALGKKVFALINYFDPSWRCSTYKNIKVYTPKVSCYPCVVGMFKSENERQCRNSTRSCYNFFNWNKIIIDISNDRIESIITKQIPNSNKCVTTNIKNFSMIEDILINRVSGVGDILIMTAIINTIRNLYPEASISCRTNQVQVLEENKEINYIIPATVSHIPAEEAKKYDLIYDFDGICEPPVIYHNGKISRQEYMSIPRLDLFYLQAKIEKPKEIKYTYNFKHKEIEEAENIWKKLGGKKRIVYSLNSISDVRTYPAYHSIVVISHLLNLGYSVIIVGNTSIIWGSKHPFVVNYKAISENFNKNLFLDLDGKTTIRQVMALINTSDLVIAPDSGLLHATGILNKKGIGLFGNIRPELRISGYSSIISISSKLLCLQECGDIAEYFQKKCPTEVIRRNRQDIGAACMKSINPFEIIKLAQEILQ